MALQKYLDTLDFRRKWGARGMPLMKEFFEKGPKIPIEFNQIRLKKRIISLRGYKAKSAPQRQETAMHPTQSGPNLASIAIRGIVVGNRERLSGKCPFKGHKRKFPGETEI